MVRFFAAPNTPVVNLAPVWAVDTPTSLSFPGTGGSYNFGLKASDPQPWDSISFSFGSTPPVGYSINSLSGMMTVINAAPNAPGLKIRATDTQGLFTDWIVAVSVQAGNQAPVFPPVFPITIPQNTAVGTVVLDFHLVGVSDPNNDPLVIYITNGTLPPGLTYDQTAWQVKVSAVLTQGNSSTVQFTADDNFQITDADWEARSKADGVVWAHPFKSLSELEKHINPSDNRDLAEPIILGISPNNVCPHLLTAAQDQPQGGGHDCLEFMQIGGELALPVPEYTLPLQTHPGVSITVESTSVGILTCPASMDGLAIDNGLSLFHIKSGQYAGLYFNTFTDGDTHEQTDLGPRQWWIKTSTFTPLIVGTPSSDFTFEHLKAKDLANPYMDIWIDEFVDEVGMQTWPSPTGWDPITRVVPADAYLFVIHDERVITPRKLYKDKCTVVAKFFDSNPASPTFKKSRLTIRRATAGHGDAGRQENFLINRYFPTSYAAGIPIGNDVTGGLARPLAALKTPDNGLDVDDRAAQGTPFAVPHRQLYIGSTKVQSYRSGYYGHPDYHGWWPDLARRFQPNTVQQNGVMPFDGSGFELAYLMKFGPTIITRSSGTKMMFIDQYQSPDLSQVVEVSPDATHQMFRWFHNYGSDFNSGIPDPTWNTPINKWFGIKFKFDAGHDNDLDYVGTSADYPLLSVSTNDTTNERITITTGLIPLRDGLTSRNDGRYFQSLENPLRLDPQRNGYFGSSLATPPIDNLFWCVQFKSGTWVRNGQKYRILNHTVAGGVTTFVLGKNKPGDTWPSDVPLQGDRCKMQWDSIANSCRYNDTRLQLFKKEVGDIGWVQLMDLMWPITYNRAERPEIAGNPPAWNQWQPTGYANIDDCNSPGRRTITTRFAEAIFSKMFIADPKLT